MRAMPTRRVRCSTAGSCDPDGVEHARISAALRSHERVCQSGSLSGGSHKVGITMNDPGDDLVVLRRLSLADVDEWLAGEDDEQIRWFEFPGPATRVHVERAIAAWQESWRNDGPVRHWGICVRPSGEIAGGVELRLLDTREVNLSYVVFPAWRRQGIATRASRLALAYGSRDLGATAAVIKVLDGNLASLAVARNLGAAALGVEPSDSGGRFVVHRLELPA
jgi:RimJ/RimL family protein N-acetyltransferase